MTVRLEVKQARSVEEDDIYRVVTLVEYNQGISRNIFVYNTETEEFQHVATPWDIENLPNNRADALAEGDSYYRLTAVTRDFSTVELAQEFAAYTLGRISTLAREYNLAVTSFEGSGTYTYTGS